MGTNSTPGSDEAPAGASGRPLISNPRPPAKCQGAMSQQGFGAHGNECYPQKLVQLVGYRDPQALIDAQTEAWERLRLKRATDQAAE
ncbi:hypothetical protein V1281_001353 [Nitrobacteraceae bacterium AZCC 2161]